MKRRGVVVEPGSRIEFVIVSHPGKKPKQFERIEDPTYIREHGDLVRPDFLYYAQNLINPVDQVLAVCFKREKVLDRLVQFHLSFKKVMDELLFYFHPFCFQDSTTGFSSTHPDLVFKKKKPQKTPTEKKKEETKPKKATTTRKQSDTKASTTTTTESSVKKQRKKTASALQIAQDLLTS
jgi:hypothetical protein